MPYFEDAAELYSFIGRLCEQLAADEQIAPQLRAADTVVRFEHREPDSQLTVQLCETEPIVVDCGASALEPEVVMTMDADTAHRFWLGKVNVTVALARGQITAKGPVAKILRLVPLVKPAFARYAAMLEDAGRDDLLAPLREREPGDTPPADG